MNDVTEILERLKTGHKEAATELLPVLYDELRMLARSRLKREGGPQSIQATALVHEAWLRLVGGLDDAGDPKWDNRRHFFGAAAEAMRRILVDRARARNAQKRGGQFQRVELDPIEHPAASDPDELLALHAALDMLEAEDPAKAELVKLRFFAGLTGRQAAAALGVSESTADRHWSYARAWLRTKMA